MKPTKIIKTAIRALFAVPCALFHGWCTLPSE